MFQAAVGQGWMTRSEFWDCHPIELWWLLEAKKPVKMYGNMTEYEVKEIYEDEFGPYQSEH